MSETSKTNRSFQCRDALWEKFEQMARELECSVDYLINDAMKQYARQRGYGSTKGIGSSTHASMVPPAPPGAAPGATAPPAPAPAPIPAAGGRTRLGPPPVPPGVGVPPVAPPPPPAMAPPAMAPPAAPPPPPLPPVGMSVPPPLPASPIAPGGVAPPPPPTGGPPPRPRQNTGARRAPPPPPGTRAGRQPLNIYYMGERFPINKDRFIIGRGRQSSDLTIKDPNVSRQHAMVEFLNGQYFMVDMGSTNGVEYGGQRVQRQVVNDGDTFRVCDHELRFSFR